MTCCPSSRLTRPTRIYIVVSRCLPLIPSPTKAYQMCLVKVHEEPDVVVPYRVASRRRSHYSSYSPPRSARLSRTIVDERRPPSVVSHHFEKTRVSAVDAPPPKAIPPPQPVPVFVKPPSPPPPPPAPPRPASPPLAHHLVEVSPASSRTSISESDYIVREHEVHRHRATEYSPSRSSVTDHSPRYETCVRPKLHVWLGNMLTRGATQVQVHRTAGRAPVPPASQPLVAVERAQREQRPAQPLR